MSDVEAGMEYGPFSSNTDLAEFLSEEVGVLVHAAHGVTEEPDKHQTIFDGTSCGWNDKIRCNITSKHECPVAPDLRHALRLERGTSTRDPLGDEARYYAKFGLPAIPRPLGLLQVDASKAHKRIHVAPKDQKRLLAKVRQQRFVCRTFPYGLASA